MGLERRDLSATVQNQGQDHAAEDTQRHDRPVRREWHGGLSSCLLSTAWPSPLPLCPEFKDCGRGDHTKPGMGTLSAYDSYRASPQSCLGSKRRKVGKKSTPSVSLETRQWLEQIRTTFPSSRSKNQRKQSLFFLGTRFSLEFWEGHWDGQTTGLQARRWPGPAPSLDSPSATRLLLN